MADDIKLKWGSTGFEKIAGELAQMEKQAGGAGKWFTPMQQNLQETEKAGTNMSSSLLSSLGSIMPVVGQVAIKIAEIGTAIMATAAVITGAGVAAFTMWSNSILKTTESFSMLEISMYGATKSWESVAKVSEFAKGYAAEYPAMYKDVMQAMQSFAYISSMRPMIERGDVKEMKEMMDVIQGLITMRPEQGVTGAMMALREALGGNWRSLQMRFDVPIKSIAASAGMTMEQMKASPEAGAKALKAFIDSFVGAETMAMMAKNLTIQIGNLKDKYEMWLDTLGKTGIYQKVVDYVIKLNDVMEQVSKSEQWQKFTVQLNAVLEGIAEGIAGIFTKGVGWDKVIDLTSLLGALDKVANNAMEAMSAAWDKLKEPLFAAMNLALLWAQQKLIVATREIFIPVGIGIGQAIIQGMKQFMERPG